MVHCYEMNGYRIAIDGNSGSIHVVDELAYDVIRLYETKNRDEIVASLAAAYRDRPDIDEAEIDAVLADIETLKAAGNLFSADLYGPEAGKKREGGPVLKALCLHVAHACNLSCTYCFAGQGAYAGDRGLMSFVVGKKALDHLIAHSGKRRNLEVDFFGGEPLLNFRVVRELVAYGRSREQETGKRFRFTLTTNGVLLDDEVMEFANREMHNVVLSLDGRREVNDRMRAFPNGKGSYDLILPKFKRMAALRNEENYYLRGTYTHENTDFVEDILHMADLGFRQISMEPVVAPASASYALKEEDLPALLAGYERLAGEMLARSRRGEGFQFFHYLVNLGHGPCLAKRVSGCGVGSEYLAVTPEGDFYPCHQFVGEKEFLMGNVEEGVTRPDLQDMFAACNVYSRAECRDCFARFYCGGGCTANAYHATGSVNGVYALGCELHRKRIECAIMLQAATAETR